MARPSVEAATCTECGENDDNFSETDFEMDIQENRTISEVECECGATGTITVDMEGTHGSDTISFEDAPWSDSDESEGGEDDE